MEHTMSEDASKAEFNLDAISHFPPDTQVTLLLQATCGELSYAVALREDVTLASAEGSVRLLQLMTDRQIIYVFMPFAVDDIPSGEEASITFSLTILEQFEWLKYKAKLEAYERTLSNFLPNEVN